MTTVDSTPPEVYRWNVVICPELIDPSATGTAWAASPLTAWWSTERWVDVTVECLVGWKWSVVWLSGYMAKKGVTTVIDGIGDISCHGDVFVSG